MEALFTFIISILASIIGAICGIGGGVIIKPVLDLTGIFAIATINFLSCCTVLSMSSYSVARNIISKNNDLELKTGLFLSIGAIIGGIAGKLLFSFVASLFTNPNDAGKVQAIALGVVTLGTMLYIIFNDKIKTKSVTNIFLKIVIGFVLGITSSFLGIGGGPINIVVLKYFFSMDTKKAAQNSLYVICLSQLSTLLTTIISGDVPNFIPLVLIAMIVGGIGGGIIGRLINKKINSKVVDKLLLILMCIIIAICVINFIK